MNYFITSQDSSVGIGMDGSGSIPGRDKICLLSLATKPALGHAEFPIQCSKDIISSGVDGRSVKLTGHLQLVPRLRMVEITSIAARLHRIIMN
jgi:hypothetical protein